MGNYHQSVQAIQSCDYAEFKMADVALKMLNKSMEQFGISIKKVWSYLMVYCSMEEKQLICRE